MCGRWCIDGGNAYGNRGLGGGNGVRAGDGKVRARCGECVKWVRRGGEVDSLLAGRKVIASKVLGLGKICREGTCFTYQLSRRV